MKSTDAWSAERVNKGVLGLSSYDAMARRPPAERVNKGVLGLGERGNTKCNSSCVVGGKEGEKILMWR